MPYQTPNKTAWHNQIVGMDIGDCVRVPGWQDKSREPIKRLLKRLGKRGAMTLELRWRGELAYIHRVA